MFFLLFKSYLFVFYNVIQNHVFLPLYFGGVHRVITIRGLVHKKTGITKSNAGTGSSSCGATPLGTSYPLCTYYHTLTLDHGVSAPSHILDRKIFLLALKSPFNPAFRAAITPPATLTFEPLRNLLTLSQRFIKK